MRDFGSRKGHPKRAPKRAIEVAQRIQVHHAAGEGQFRAIPGTQYQLCFDGPPGEGRLSAWRVWHGSWFRVTGITSRSGWPRCRTGGGFRRPRRTRRRRRSSGITAGQAVRGPTPASWRASKSHGRAATCRAAPADPGKGHENTGIVSPEIPEIHGPFALNSRGGRAA
jgi:hypothetical protein